MDEFITTSTKGLIPKDAYKLTSPHEDEFITSSTNGLIPRDA